MDKPQKKRRRPRRGFVACPACGTEARIGIRTCPECGAKLPGKDGGGGAWIVGVILAAIAAVCAGAYFMSRRERAPARRRKPKPKAEVAAPAPKPSAQVTKPEKAEPEPAGDVLEELFGGGGLPEPDIEAPGTAPVEAEKKEGTAKLQE